MELWATRFDDTPWSSRAFVLCGEYGIPGLFDLCKNYFAAIAATVVLISVAYELMCILLQLVPFHISHSFSLPMAALLISYANLPACT